MRVEELRAKAERIADELAQAEVVLERRVIAREELVEALAASRDRVEDAVPDPRETAEAAKKAPVAGAVVPRWQPDATPEALVVDYRRILELVQLHSEDGEGISAKQLAAGLELELAPAKIEGVRSKARRLAERGWLMASPSGRFTPWQPTGPARPVAGKQSGPGGG
ncbi:hypothetical protein [Streptomyces sp. NPDC051994]|uniref:hypothetical protein n=1 Tax=unclassified Streptomyces TaxID=2593676 RepID=UPI00343C4D54